MGHGKQKRVAGLCQVFMKTILSPAAAKMSSPFTLFSGYGCILHVLCEDLFIASKSS